MRLDNPQRFIIPKNKINRFIKKRGDCHIDKVIRTIKGLSDTEIYDLFEKYRPDLHVIRIFSNENYSRIVTVKNKNNCVFNIYKIPEALNNPKSFNIIRYTTESISNFITETTNGEYSLVGECKKYNDIIQIKHNLCGNTFTCRASHYVNDGGVQCKECLISKMKKSEKDVDTEIASFGNPNIIRVSDYKNYHSKMQLLCKTCNRTFSNSLVNLKRQYDTFGEIHCPLCHSGSIGEKHVQEILVEYKVAFEREFRFNDCKDKHALPFDFVILDTNGKPIKAIEFDGKQHYTNTSKFANSNIQKHDSIKTQYCISHNIPLLRTSQLNKAKLELEIKKFLGI